MQETLLLFRWIHIIAGIAWIGLLYFFNFVNVPLQAALADDAKKQVNPQMMPRVLWWFRWAAMVTFLAGLVLFAMLYWPHPGGVMWDAAGNLSSRAKWILMGMIFGTVMWFNVWFIIWPAQRKLLGGTAGDQAPALRKRALIASRTNAFLSGPMLFGMVNGAHSYVQGKAAAAIAVVLGLAAIWASIQASYNVGKTV